MLDKRLLACAGYIRTDKKMCDVGTDHAYLPCYLVEQGLTKAAIAADVNENPLRIAEKTVAERGLTGRIRVVQSDGLLNIPADEADDVVIAGMGGELIAKLVLACDWLKDPARRLILQPMTNHSILRNKLYENGFAIESETPVFENGHHYSVLYCYYSGKQERIGRLFAVTGKVPERQDGAAADYLSHIQRKCLKIAEGLERSKDRVEEAEECRKLADQIGDLIGSC